MKHKIGIIGAGPAGIACAIQLRRFGLEPVIYEKAEVGGLLKNANFVENYLGFPFGISPAYLIEGFMNHLVRYEVDIRYQEVISVEYQKKKFLLKTRAEENFFDYLVIASGTRPRRLEAFDKQGKDKVFYEVFPLKKVKGKEIGIIGAGDAAFDYALTLASTNQVKIFNRTDQIKCLPLLFERCEKNANIKYFPEKVLKSLTDKEKYLSVEFTYHNERVEYLLDYIIFATGRDPQLGFLDGSLQKHFEKLKEEQRLYLIGDVKNELNRQVAIAAGDGIRVAMEINIKLSKA